MSKNSIQDKKKSHLKQKVAWAEPRLKMTNCCLGAAHRQNIWRSSGLHQKCKKRLSTCRRVFMLATIQRISSVFKSRRDGGHEVKLIRDRFSKKDWFIWRSWSWNESDGACDRVIWSESGAVLGTASSGSETCQTKIRTYSWLKSKQPRIKTKYHTRLIDKPSSHARGAPAPHRRRGRHSTGRRKSPRGRTDPLGQDSGGRYLLTIDLTWENQNHWKFRIIEQERKVTESKLSTEETLSNSEKANRKTEWMTQAEPLRPNRNRKWLLTFCEKVDKSRR